jgi:inosose dehydratase
VTSSWPTATRSAIHPGPQSTSPFRSQSGGRRVTSAAAEAEVGSDAAAGRSLAATGQPARRRLARSPIGVVPITWNNVDLTDLAPEVPAATVLDACAELGFEGVQLGRGFPRGHELQTALRDRHLRLAEVYAELPMSPDGPSDDAVEIGRERLALLNEGGGDVLVAACRVGGGRESWAARADDPAAPRLSEKGWRRLADVFATLAADARQAGRTFAFHPHAGTFVETPDEIRRLAAVTDPARVAICLDAGHATVGGGDAVALVAELGPRIRHVHVKDVDPAVLADLRAGRLPDFAAAIRARLFTELGRGALDVDGLVGALEAVGYGGWLMVEQDSTWLVPAESLRIGRAALVEALSR